MRPLDLAVELRSTWFYVDVLQAVLMALWQRTDQSPVILHSDRGCQFSSDEYQRFLQGHQIRSSMSAVGTCADNAAAESFFGLLKRERVNQRQYRTRSETRADVFDYIERFHNPRRATRIEQLRKKQVWTSPKTVDALEASWTSPDLVDV
jgi:putative transposase